MLNFNWNPLSKADCDKKEENLTNQRKNDIIFIRVNMVHRIPKKSKYIYLRTMRKTVTDHSLIQILVNTVSFRENKVWCILNWLHFNKPFKSKLLCVMKNWIVYKFLNTSIFYMEFSFAFLLKQLYSFFST